MENSDSIIFNPIHICHDADLAMIIAPGPDRREIITLTDMEDIDSHGRLIITTRMAATR